MQVPLNWFSDFGPERPRGEVNKPHENSVIVKKTGAQVAEEFIRTEARRNLGHAARAIDSEKSSRDFDFMVLLAAGGAAQFAHLGHPTSLPSWKLSAFCWKLLHERTAFHQACMPFLPGPWRTTRTSWWSPFLVGDASGLPSGLPRSWRGEWEAIASDVLCPNIGVQNGAVRPLQDLQCFILTKLTS